ncbi:PKD domain-containing protein [Mucilaginibacter pedocola]|uniref:PKD domain-containing protein n=1 Tax=Mucilaginibacter pedocola TaxID=1792845 RepID=A0A1S9PEZ4_9SPHI|nr:PKD domain-containing protein [Mucilaginibacter pedocola]OOQ59531.1 hypothetical protein BC343_04995 [Mucilaginibacter pedocola]
MKKNFTYYLCGIVIAALALGSCKKSGENGNGTKAVFSYVADGYNVNFTNFSTNATEYSWDFGDGSAEGSTKKAPQHIFKSKGDFLVTLTAKSGEATSTFKDTVSIIGPNIKIDGDFTDWQYVDYAYTNTLPSGGTLTGIKTFASSTDIFFLLEGTADMKMEILDVYIDADNNNATGYTVGSYPAASGADYLLEGSLTGGWGNLFQHVGGQNSFSFNVVGDFPDVFHYSTVKTVAGKNIIELSIKKDKLGTTKNFVNFAFMESTSGWATIGIMPENGAPTSAFLKVTL